MKARTVVPRQPGTATLWDMPEPSESDAAVLVETMAAGVCGTDAISHQPDDVKVVTGVDPT